MNQLKTLFDSTPFSVNDYAYLLGVTKRNLTRWLRDEAIAPDDVIGRAIQIEADCASVRELLKAHDWLEDFSYIHFKYSLDW